MKHLKRILVGAFSLLILVGIFGLFCGLMSELAKIPHGVAIVGGIILLSYLFGWAYEHDQKIEKENAEKLRSDK